MEKNHNLKDEGKIRMQDKNPLENFTTWAEIDLDNLAYNMKKLKKYVGKNTKVMAIVKADAYGHGAVEVSKEVLKNGATGLGVGGIDEAIELRASGIDQDILNLFNVRPLEPEISKAIKFEITQSISTLDVAQILSKLAKKNDEKVKVHIKTDTGLGRLGIPYNYCARFVEKVNRLPNIEIEGMFSTFAESGEKYTRKQFDRFLSVAKELEKKGMEIPLKHIVSSNTLFKFKDMYLDMVRLGITIYGLYPDEPTKEIELKPAMQLKTRINYVKSVPENTSIGFNRTYLTKANTKIATLSIGYYDGLNRMLSNKGSVLVKGEKVPIVGKVSINHCMVEISNIDAKTGDEVVIFGNQGDEKIDVDEIADLSNTINYEVICKIGQKLPRVYMKNGRIYRIRRIKPVYDEISISKGG